MMKSAVWVLMVVCCVVVVIADAKLGEPGYCHPNENFMDECNHCTCSPDGKTATCTDRACPSHHREARSTGPRPGQRGYCVPNTSFPSPDGCNTCRCNAEGTNAGCTEKACIG